MWRQVTQLICVASSEVQTGKVGKAAHPPPGVHLVRVVAHGHDLIGLHMVVVRVLVDVVHKEFGDLAQDLLHGLALIVDEAVDEAVARVGARQLLAVGEVEQAPEGDGRHLVHACWGVPAATTPACQPVRHIIKLAHCFDEAPDGATAAIWHQVSSRVLT